MTIYILDNDPKKCAEMLDDRSLNCMIRDIAHVLCNVHWILYPENNPPLKPKMDCDFSRWARNCVANYKYLLELGQQCCIELNYRMKGLRENQIKLEKILLWTGNNIPDLQNRDNELECECHQCYECFKTFHQPFPLVMPNKYIDNGYKYQQDDMIDCIIDSYRDCYQAKLTKEKRLKLKKKCGHDSCWYSNNNQNGMCHKQNLEPFWTNRNKPEWLSI